MNRLYDMVQGRFVDEPKEDSRQLEWSAEARWPELQLVPVIVESRRVTMPPELAEVSVAAFLAAQGC
jgi:hypothetical protein